MPKFKAETTELEFKRELNEKDPKGWLKTVSAFANGIGGTIYFGIENNTREIVGVNNSKDVLDKISDFIKGRMSPIPETVLTEEIIEGLTIIKLEVSAGQKTPYYYSKGGSKEAYIRIGNSSEPCPDYILNELIQKGNKQSYDAVLSNKKIEDLSFTLFKATYLQRCNTKLNETDFESFGLADADGYLTNAGLLFSDQCPILQSRIFCTRWDGLTKAGGVVDALDDKEFSGNLIQLLQDGENFIKLHNKTTWYKTGSGRVEITSYHPVAVYELLVNALIHRDYNSPGSEIQIAIFDDRMEIGSPGGMYDRKRIDTLDLKKLPLPSSRRNPIIADVFQRMRFMERRGSGYEKIMTALKNDTSKIDIYSDHSYFRATLYDYNYIATHDAQKLMVADENTSEKAQEKGKELAKSGEELAKSGEENSILTELMKSPNITRAKLSEATGIAPRTLDRIMKKLKDNKIIERVGSDTKGEWKIRK